LKVVFDTNIYVSEALFDAIAEVVVGAGRDGNFYVYVSEYILSETDKVLLRLGATRRFAAMAVQRIRPFAHIVHTADRNFPVLADAKDHPVLETAINCAADYLVTGDRQLCGASPYHCCPN
jgi:putative PIN family toxin of toxin-antitoxin system